MFVFEMTNFMQSDFIPGDKGLLHTFSKIFLATLNFNFVIVFFELVANSMSLVVPYPTLSEISAGNLKLASSAMPTNLSEKSYHTI